MTHDILVLRVNGGLSQDNTGEKIYSASLGKIDISSTCKNRDLNVRLEAIN